MTNPDTPSRHPFEPREADLAAAAKPANDFERFLGGTPSAVMVRLLVLSLIVGFFLVWLDIRPLDILHGLQNMFARFWNMGFDALREVLEYIAAGAAIVVPLWLFLRLLNMRSRP